MFRLLVTHGHEEQVFAVPEDEAQLGSSAENDIILRVRGVSRRHALVRPIPGGIELQDLNSKNRLFVAGEQVTRAVLTPGLRVQIGAAWLEIEEISTTEEGLARLSQNSSEFLVPLPCNTSPMSPDSDPQSISQIHDALALASHLTQVGVGVPGERIDLLLRIKAILGAEAFATFDKRLRGKLRLWEGVGSFRPKEIDLLSSLVDGIRVRCCQDLILGRTGRILLAGRDSWFLGAKFTEECSARERWRKEFLRTLAAHFFPPVRSLEEVAVGEVRRVLGLVRGNKSRMTKLIRLGRTTFYDGLGKHFPRR